MQRNLAVWDCKLATKEVHAAYVAEGHMASVDAVARSFEPLERRSVDLAAFVHWTASAANAMTLGLLTGPLAHLIRLAAGGAFGSCICPIFYRCTPVKTLTIVRLSKRGRLC